MSHATTPSTRHAARVVAAALVWAALWLASGIMLRRTDYFGHMIPVLVAGSLLGVAGATAARSNRMRVYLVGQLVVWTALMAATAVVLTGTPYLVRLLPVFSVAGLWFLAVDPLWALRERHD